MSVIHNPSSSLKSDLCCAFPLQEPFTRKLAELKIFQTIGKNDDMININDQIYQIAGEENTVVKKARVAI